MEKKKIGLVGALLMGIGCIIGSGIFGSLPTVANEYGAGVIWALIGAAVVVILRAISLTYTTAALPVSGAQFMWASKLIHPYAGAFISFSTLLMPTMVSLFGVLFAMYFQPLFPSLTISPTILSVGLLVIFSVVAWFGNKTAVDASVGVGEHRVGRHVEPHVFHGRERPGSGHGSTACHFDRNLLVRSPFRVHFLVRRKVLQDLRGRSARIGGGHVKPCFPGAVRNCLVACHNLFHLSDPLFQKNRLCPDEAGQSR